VAAWVSVRVLTAVDLGALWARPGGGGFPSFWPAVDLVIAMPVSWIPLVADYNRFARRAVGSGVGTYGGYLLANVWFYSLGALLILGAGGGPSVTGIADAIVSLTGGVLVLVVLLVGETDEAFADIYSAAVSSQNLVPRLNQRIGVLSVAALGVAGAAWLFGLPGGGVDTYEFFLFLIGSVFVPLFGVFLADYFVLRRGTTYRHRDLFDSRGPYRYAGGFNVAALAAWVVGFGVYHWIAPTPVAGWAGAVEAFFARWLHLPFPLLGGRVPASVAAFAAAFLLYLPLGAWLRVSRSSSEERGEGPSPSG
jgi:putative hydroxymethylpyrimidine transporter CytX